MAKLNFYKFVNPGGLRDKNLESITIAAKKYALRKKGQTSGGGESDVTNVVNAGNRKVLLATNRIGSSLNSSLVALDELNQTQKKLDSNLLGINKSVVDQTKAEEKHRKKLEEVLKRQTTLKRGAESEAAAENRGPKDKKQESGGVVKAVGKAAGGLLGFLSGLVGKFVVPLIGLGVAEWLSKPGNAEKAAEFMKFIGNIAKFFMKIIDFGVVQVLEGLGTLFDSDANIFQKIIGFFQLAIGVFTLLGTWAILTGKVGFILKGLKVAMGVIKALPVALSLAAKAATAIKTFASTPVGKAAILFGAGAAIPALFPGTVETEADKNVDKSSAEKGSDATLAKLKEERSNIGPFDYITGKAAELDKQIYRLEKGKEPDFGFGKDGIGPGNVPAPPSVSPNDPAGKQTGKTVQGASGNTYITEINGQPQQLPKEAQDDIAKANQTRTALGEAPQFMKGGISDGPDGGYLAVLHGKEAVIPLDNKFTRSGGNPLANLVQEKSLPENKTVRGLVGTKSVQVGNVNVDTKWNPAAGDTTLRGLLASLVTGIKYQAQLFAKVMNVKLDTGDPDPSDTPDSTPPPPPPAASGGGDGEDSKSSGGDKTNAPSATPVDKSSLETKTIDELKKMLDPTKPGAQDPAVFKAASEARRKYRTAGKQEQERQVLIATILAKQDVTSPPSTDAETTPVETKLPVLNQFANGGSFNNVISGSGYINGPMSGYPVYMNGGITPSFIGHGLEYVTSASKGGFVIPIDTPATKSQGGLFQRRVKEATSKGYKHPFSSGGLLGYQGGGQVKSKTGEGKTGDQADKPKLHPYLVKLGDEKIKKASAPPGYCVTGSLNTMQKSGVPNPAATGSDVGNNPRGAAVQLIKSFGWKSIGGTTTTLKSPYGTVSTGIFNKAQYDTAVKEGKIPSGALVFQTRHSSWNGTSPRSRGYDMAIAQKKGTGLWNGVPLGKWVYGDTKHVIALTPDGKTGDGKPPEISGSDDPSAAANGVGPGGTTTGGDQQEQTPEQSFQSALSALISASQDAKTAFAEMDGVSPAQISPTDSSATIGKKIDAKSKDLHKAFTEPSNVTPEIINQSFSGAAPPIINTDQTAIPIPNYEGGVSPWRFEGPISFSDGIGSTQELSKIK
jgi:hypothetical protein